MPQSKQFHLELTPLEAQLLDCLQVSFPVEAKPYHSLAKQTNTTAEEALDAVSHLRREGVIRRTGGVINLTVVK